MNTDGWQWAVGMLSAPRREHTVGRVLESLARAGFSNVLTCSDIERRGHTRSWLHVLRLLLQMSPNADAYFVCEDDVVFCLGLRDYLERSLWPAQRETVAICSPYSPTPYCRSTRGWHCENHGFSLISSLTWILSPETARAILSRFDSNDSFSYNADAIIGDWALRADKSVWYHTPSLAQHVGLGNSALGDNSISDIRQAVDFVGEQFHA